MLNAVLRVIIRDPVFECRTDERLTIERPLLWDENRPCVFFRNPL
jgi:hypothetical protein